MNVTSSAAAGLVKLVVFQDIPLSAFDGRRVLTPIEALVVAARKMKVRLELGERQDGLWLSFVDRKVLGGERGSGADAIRLVLQYADEVGKPVRLMVIDCKRLVRYYRRLGFAVESKIKCDGFEIDFYMVRWPNDRN